MGFAAVVAATAVVPTDVAGSVADGGEAAVADEAAVAAAEGKMMATSVMLVLVPEVDRLDGSSAGNSLAAASEAGP